MKKWALLAVLAQVACGTPVPEMDVEACEHIEETGKALTASATESGAPALSDDHVRNDLTLVSATGGNGGYASLTVTEEHDYFVYLNKDVALKVTNSSGVAVEFEKTEKSIAACTAVKAKYTLELKPGTYLFNFGPTTETTVSLVIEHGEHSHE